MSASQSASQNYAEKVLASSVKFYPTQHDLPEDIRIQVAEILNQTLFVLIDLKGQVKYAHWNVKGLNFYPLHQLFDEIAGQLEGFSDAVAERVATLGSTALGTVRLAAQGSNLPEYDLNSVDGKEHLAALVQPMTLTAQMVRVAIEQTADLGDADTSDLYTEISRSIDKYLWFIESHLQTPDRAEIR